MHRIPVTLADLQGTRYKSSLSKFKKHSLSVLAVPKLSALREAFAKALGYGTEAELRFYAKKLGDSYTGVALPVTDVIESVSKRIARQWDVSAEHAEKISYSLGLQHFDACRTTPRVNLRNIDGDGTSRSATQVLKVEPLESQSSEEDRAAIHAVPQILTSNTLQADLDGLQFERDRFKAERDRLAKAYPALTAIDRVMKANPRVAERWSLEDGDPENEH